MFRNSTYEDVHVISFQYVYIPILEQADKKAQNKTDQNTNIAEIHGSSLECSLKR